MANITKRVNKDGSVSYRIRAYSDERHSGKQIMKSTTWKPPQGMRPSTADKQAEKEASLFEERLRSSIISFDGNMKFSEYAAHWMEAAELAPKTREQYNYVLRRINQAIGHIALDKLRVEHLLKFFKNLREEGIKETGTAAVTSNLRDYRKTAYLTQSKLSGLAGISLRTVIAAERGERISLDSARKICSVINHDIETIFTVNEDKNAGKLSDRTIWHHYKVIRAILSNAKKSQILGHNVTEYMDAPKIARKEIKHLDDEEARRFLDLLMEESDIRIKTSLTLDLFTGLRRGELCGLEWPDIDFANNIVHVRRASQYIPGKGIIEVPTKNASSKRSINITPFVTSMLKEYKIWWMEHKMKNGTAWQGDKNRLFIQNDGKPIFPDTINLWLSKFIEKHDFPHITPHGLRHSFITLQITSGVDLRTIQARSGHAQASTLLNTYSHAVKSSQEKAAQIMDDVLLGKVASR